MRHVVIRSMLLSAFVTAAVGAQTPSVTLPARLTGETRAILERLIDSARVAGLPASALADKAAEGVLKGGTDQRIIMAVRTLARELGEARTVLGSSADVALLSAAASALHAGVAPVELRSLARPNGDAADSHTLATALITLGDLVAKGIPPTSATAAVNELLKRRAAEDQFVMLRGEVEQDIRGGAAPEAALTKRIRSHVELLDALPLSRRVVKPPPGNPPIGTSFE